MEYLFIALGLALMLYWGEWELGVVLLVIYVPLTLAKRKR
jgi:hypothetical protein